MRSGAGSRDPESTRSLPSLDPCFRRDDSHRWLVTKMFFQSDKPFLKMAVFPAGQHLNIIGPSQGGYMKPWLIFFWAFIAVALVTGIEVSGQPVEIDIFFDTQADDFYGGAIDPLVSLGTICGPGRIMERVNPGAYQVKAFFRPDVQVYEMRFDTYSADGIFETSTTLPAGSPAGDVSITLATGKQYSLIVFVTEG